MASPNTIAKRVNELPALLDLAYKKASVTAILEKPSSIIQETGMASTVKIAKRSLTGYGDYTRTNGQSSYPVGGVTLAWETHQISNDRAVEFQVDRLDNDETGENAFMSIASLGGQFMREAATPEIDATRFATMAGTSGISTTTAAVLSAALIKAAIDTAIATMDGNEVPEENRVLFLSTSNYNFLKNASAFTYNLVANPTTGVIDTRVAEYDGMPVIKVPQSRFYTAIDLYDGVTTGETAGGYVKASGGVSINFMIVHQEAALPIKVLDKMKYFSPDENQKSDDHLVQSRLYHDIFVPENKVKGIYLHKSTS